MVNAPLREITNCDNPDCQRIAKQWLEMINEKFSLPPRVRRIIKIPFLNAVIQFINK